MNNSSGNRKTNHTLWWKQQKKKKSIINNWLAYCRIVRNLQKCQHVFIVYHIRVKYVTSTCILFVQSILSIY